MHFLKLHVSLKDISGLLHLQLILSAFIPIGYDNIALTNLIAEMWEHGDITATKSDGVGNMGCKQANSLTKLELSPFQKIKSEQMTANM